MKKRIGAVCMTILLAAGLAACQGSSGSGQGTGGQGDGAESQPATEHSEEIETEDGVAAENQDSQAEAEKDTAEEHAAQTETQKPAGPSEEEIGKAYLQILQRYEGRIRAYDWQEDWGQGTGRPIAIHDVNGDEIPELLFVMIPEGKNGAQYMGDLHIYTYEADEKEAEELYEKESWDVAVAGGTRYCLFLEEDGSFHAYTSFGDDTWTNTWSLFSMQGDDDMALTLQAQRYDYPTEDYSQRLQEYTGADEKEMTEDAYEQQKAALTAGMEVCILQGNLDDEDMRKAVSRAGSVAMTYDEAVRFLQGMAGSAEAKSIDAGTLFAALDDLDFYFASGAGGWATELDIEEDGSFSGSYYDGNLGETGDGYPNGTVYVSEFEGRFSNPEKLDDYSYRMKLESLRLEEEPGKTRTEDGVRYVASEAYGFEGSEGQEFILYLPGAPTKDMPEDCLNWLGMPRAWSSVPDKLPVFALYNVTNRQAFGAEPVGYDGQDNAGAAGTGEQGSLQHGGEQGLLPESSQRLLTASDIAGMSDDDIQLAINTIYARHGYRFKDSDLLAYFGGFSWYDPVYSDMEDAKVTFSEIEEENVKFLAGSL